MEKLTLRAAIGLNNRLFVMAKHRTVGQLQLQQTNDETYWAFNTTSGGLRAEQVEGVLNLMEGLQARELTLEEQKKLA